MPIKFRCKYCQQFLGIALSRAGAIVDCPQCGRSLQVPDPDGRARRSSASAAAPASQADADFLAALTELSALGPQSSAKQLPVATANRATDAGRPAVSATAATVAIATTVVPVAIPSVPPMSAPETADVPDDRLNLQEQDDPLLELAALSQSPNSPETSLSEDLLSEMHQVSHPGASPLLQIFGGMLLLLIGAACGWWLAKSGTLLLTADPNPTVSPDQVFPDNINPPALPVEGPAANDDSAHADGFRGSVTWTDASGTQRPDSGALVLLLPLQRAGTLKLDAQSLMRPSDHPDHKATLAALSQLGGDFAEADQTGRFAVRRPATPDDQLIVISRHLQRPADLAAPTDVAQILQTWFVSSSRMTGRLQMQLLQPAAENQQQDVVFGNAAGAK